MEKTSFSAEEKLKIACLRAPSSTPATDSTIQSAISNEINWSAFLEALVNDGVSQIVYWNLKKGGLSGFFPGDIYSSLKDRYLNSLGHNLTLGRIMGEVLRDLGDVDIMALKGAALAAAAYEDIGLRGFSDVDLLVKKEDVERVDEVLRNKWGFNMLSSNLRCREYLAQGRSWGVEYPIAVDLSWEIVPAERFANVMKWDAGSVWRSSVKCEIFGRRMNIPSAEDSLIFSVYHMVFHHNFIGILWFIDIQQMVRKWKDGIDWDKVVSDAARYGIGALTYRALLFAADMLGADIPQDAIEKFKKRVSGASLRRLSAYAAGPNGLTRGPAAYAGPNGLARGSTGRIFHPLVLDNTASILRMLFAFIFPSRQWLKFRFGETADARGVIHPGIRPHKYLLAQWLEYISCLIKGYL